MRAGTGISLSVVLLALVAALLSYWGFQSNGEPAMPALNPVAAALGDAAGTEGYARAVETRTFEFPRDHGAHPAFRNEWWYFTGNLKTADGRRFGYQLTFFRIALVPQVVDSGSSWRTNQMYMAHFALSDFDRAGHRGFERFGRGAAGLAGAENPPLRVWLDHWTLEAEDISGFPIRLRAEEEGVAIDLLLNAEKPIVLHGDQGLSRKGGGEGNASYYYSMTRLGTSGTVTTGGERLVVNGISWLDREWSTSALAPDQAGWDWFAIQFDDGRDLMFYRMRKQDGTTDPASAGTLVSQDGTVRHLTASEMGCEVVGEWTSPESGVGYPTRWRLELPSEGLTVDIAPVFDAQEMDVSVRYWEGAIVVRGHDGGGPVAGRGYMELAGYADG